MQYMPDWESGKKLPPRDFFWHILNKIKPDYVKHLVANAIAVREGLHSELESKQKVVQVKSELIERMLAAPFCIGK